MASSSRRIVVSEIEKDTIRSAAIEHNRKISLIIHQSIYPRSMVPSGGSCQNFEETMSIPANSRRFQSGLQRSRPEIYAEDGSSIPAGISPYRNR